MRILSSFTLSAVASIVASYLLSRVFSTTPGPDGSGGKVAVVVVIPVIAGNNFSTTSYLLGPRRGSRMLKRMGHGRK
jgi:hypothetical protein